MLFSKSTDEILQRWPGFDRDRLSVDEEVANKGTFFDHTVFAVAAVLSRALGGRRLTTRRDF
ncbi:MAG: hypothetical protein H0T71_16545 [Acidobacteria bacterium]|nr:hypothetical protein [Acidobacteriota bacterium]